MIAALLLTTIVALSGPPPLAQSPMEAVPVSGCHADVRTHFVPEYGLITPHAHRKTDCAPLIATGGGRVEHNDRRRSRDCHEDVRRHYVDGVLLTHRHYGKDCRIRKVYRSTVP